MNRVIQIHYGDGTTLESQVSYAYDQGPNALGRLTEMTDPSGSTQWTYDGHGRVIGKTQTVGSLTHTLTYTYDTTTGRLQSLTYPSGAVLTYGYSQGQLASLALALPGQSTETLLTNLHTQPFGPLKDWTWGNETPHVRAFDLDGRLTSYPLGTNARTLDYDLAGRIQSQTDSTGTQLFGYDALDRLTSDALTPSPTSFSYDPTGNRITQQQGTNVYTYTTDPASNRLLSTTGPTPANYTYDAAGNRLSGAGVTSTYDARGRLMEVNAGGTTTHYLINGLGQRVKKANPSLPTDSTTFLYDEAGHLLGEYDASNNVIEETVYLGDMPVAVIKDNAIHYIHADQLNTPRLITDTEDAIRWRWDSDTFGNGTPNQNPAGLGNFAYNLRFPGQYFDAETGSHYNYFRDYEPKVGRYVESDPIGLRGGLNTYTYVGNNPLSFTDPYGLWTWPSSRDVVNYWGEAFGGVEDFTRNYVDLRDANRAMLQGKLNPTGTDKYFHCRANCEAAQRGPGGEDAACAISDTREWWDQNIKGYPVSDSAADQAANRYGRGQGSINPGSSCSQLCVPFRPPGLPAQY